MKFYNKKIKFGILIVVVCTLLFFLHYLKILSPIENLISRALSPAQKYIYQAAQNISYVYTNASDRVSLEKKVMNLEQQLSENMVEQAKMKILEEENQFLRNQIEFKSEYNVKQIIAHVISKSQEQMTNTLTVDKGEKDGVILGSPVIIANGVIIGKIIKVSDYTAIILLINDHSAQLAASVLNNDKTIGLIKGEYGLGVKMELIPQIEDIEKGDLVITSGSEENIPRGLVIGEISSVKAYQEDVFKEAVIKLPYNLDKIYYVDILSPQSHDDI